MIVKKQDNLKMLYIVITRITSRASEYQTVLMSWYDWSETRRELLYLLPREQEQLKCLQAAKAFILKAFCLQDTLDTISDLKVKACNHGNKLSKSIERCYCNIGKNLGL